MIVSVIDSLKLNATAATASTIQEHSYIRVQYLRTQLGLRSRPEVAYGVCADESYIAKRQYALSTGPPTRQLFA